MQKRTSILIGLVLLVLIAAPVAAQNRFSLGPSIGALLTREGSIPLVGASSRLPLNKLLALRMDINTLLLFWDANLGLEISLPLGFYGKTAGGLMVSFEDKEDIVGVPYLEAGLGCGGVGFFGEVVYVLILADSDLQRMLHATMGYRFKL